MDNPTKYLDEVKTKWAAKLAERDYVTTKDAPLLKYFDMKLESYPYGNYLVNLPNHKVTYENNDLAKPNVKGLETFLNLCEILQEYNLTVEPQNQDHTIDVNGVDSVSHHYDIN